MGFRSYRFSILFSMRTSQLDKKTLWSQKNPSKGTQTKKKHKLHWSCLRSQKPTRDAPWCVFAKTPEEFESSCLGQCLVGWMWEWWIVKNPLNKKKQPTKNEWSAKIPTKTDSTVSVVSSTCGSKGIFCFLKHQPQRIEMRSFLQTFFCCWWCFLIGGHLIAKPSVPIPVMKHPSLVAPQAEKPPSRSCSRESRRWDGRGEIWLKVKPVKGKGCGEVTWKDWEQAHQTNGKFSLRSMLKLSTFEDD